MVSPTVPKTPSQCIGDSVSMRAKTTTCLLMGKLVRHTPFTSTRPESAFARELRVRASKRHFGCGHSRPASGLNANICMSCCSSINTLLRSAFHYIIKLGLGMEMKRTVEREMSA